MLYRRGDRSLRYVVPFVDDDDHDDDDDDRQSPGVMVEKNGSTRFLLASHAATLLRRKSA